MSMFTRSDKPSDTDTSKSAAPADTSAATPRPQATAQTLTNTARPVSSPAPSQTRGVSVISKALKITGQLESTEDIEIDGEIDGDVRGISVKVGRNAKVKGTIFAEEVEVAGTVDGKIEAKKVVLASTAHMSGDIVHQDITIQSGAYIDGHCRPEFGKSESRSGAAHKSSSATPEKTNGANARA